MQVPERVLTIRASLLMRFVISGLCNMDHARLYERAREMTPDNTPLAVIMKLIVESMGIPADVLNVGQASYSASRLHIQHDRSAGLLGPKGTPDGL